MASDWTNGGLGENNNLIRTYRKGGMCHVMASDQPKNIRSIRARNPSDHGIHVQTGI